MALTPQRPPVSPRSRRRPTTATVRGRDAAGARRQRGGDDDGDAQPVPPPGSGRRWRPHTARGPRVDPRESEELAELYATAHGHPTSTGSVRKMMAAQSELERRGAALAQWQSRPRSAGASRPRPPSAAAGGARAGAHYRRPSQHSAGTEVRPVDSLMEWHAVCLRYRQDLLRWKRDLARQTRDDVSGIFFPVFCPRRT
eukprot:TRINITY_DN27097_c0_g1_i1.p1 TRINITY_DN27097_c0_g1~~TRINITY_DN27097_c0_g1_i1.p1  ORF type:complete len:228 (+),score=49.41 TRINITY_DN27097_c0_g1_i1:89-685(+)